MLKNKVEQLAKKGLAKHRAFSRERRIDPCNSGCPFSLIQSWWLQGGQKCIPCAILFPEWAQNWLDENSERTYDTVIPLKPDCPCNTLGKEFVSWRIELFLTTGR